MKGLKDIYQMYYAFQRKQSLLENKQSFLMKNKDRKDIKGLVDIFWNVIRHRVKAPKNDIDWWINRPFSEFKDFVNSFDTRNQSKRRQIEILRKAQEYGAYQLGQEDGYEIWYVPNYDAACIIGRNYKNRPTHWCITSDDPEWWFDKYTDSEFIFLVRENMKNDRFDKVAIEFQDGTRYFSRQNITLWDVNDDKFDQSEYVSEDLIHYCWELLKDSGLSRDSSY